MKQDIPLSRLKNYGWNQRILTLEDFYDFCEVEGVLLIERPYRRVGRYDEQRGRPRIKLDTQSPALVRLHAAWHEAGHYAFHQPGYYGNRAKTELEADIIADCALIPRPLLRRAPIAQIMEECGYPRWLIERRIELCLRLKI
jgi:Zn-dependent peptidase ImmA (M78 family)